MIHARSIQYSIEIHHVLVSGIQISQSDGIEALNPHTTERPGGHQFQG